MSITREDIDSVHKTAKAIKAIVVGDAMLDRYIYGIVDRISPEAPVPILTHRSTILKAGGAANVALNLASWGCETTLLGIAGKDENQSLLKSVLDRHGIQHRLFTIEGRPTTVKTRVVAASHHLLRIDEETSDELTGDSEKQAIDHTLNSISAIDADLIIIQDYNKGYLTSSLISQLIDLAQKKNCFITVDPKEDHFFDYRNIDLFKPNLREACHASKKSLKPADLGQVATLWRNQMNAGTIAITLGSQGIFIQNQQDEAIISPEREIDVIDVCGAGDAVACSLTLSMMSGMEIKKSGSIANLTGAFVCSHSGVVATRPEEIKLWI